MSGLTKTVSYASPGMPTRYLQFTRTTDSLTAYGGADAPITLNAAKAVTDFTKSTVSNASMTLAGGHGQTDGKYDIFWTESSVNKRRYGMDGTIVTNALTLDGGSGDDFPTTPTTPVVCKQKSFNAAIDGDNLAMLVAFLDFGNTAATGRAHLEFQESDASAIAAVSLTGILLGQLTYELDITGGASNVLTGDPVGIVKATHNDTTYTPALVMWVAQDATP